MEATEEEARAIFFKEPLPLLFQPHQPTSTPQIELDKMPLSIMAFSMPSATGLTPSQLPTGMQYPEPDYDESDLPGASLHWEEPNIPRAGLVRSVGASAYEGGNVTQQWGGTDRWGDPQP
jgi:hypothetical protein